MITLGHVLTLSGILFAIAVAGVFLNRKNVIVLLMCIELMLLAVNFNFVAFSRFLGDINGQIFVFFILTVAAAEAAIGLAILVVLFRERRSINVEDLDTLQGLRDEANFHGADLPHHRFAPLIARSSPGSAGAVGRAGAHTRHDRGRRAVVRCRRYVLKRCCSRAGARTTAPVYTWLVSDGLNAGRVPDRSSVGDDDGGRDVRVADGAHLHHRLHARRSRLSALLQLHLAVHVLDADAGDVEQFHAAVLRLGSGRRGVLPADRLLVHAADAIFANLKAFLVNRIGDFGFVLGIAAVLYYTGSLDYATVFAHADRFAARRRSTSAARSSGRRSPSPASPVHRRDGQVGAGAAARVAAGFDGRPDADLGADPRRDHGDGGHLHGGAHVAAVRAVGNRAVGVLIIGATTAFFMGLLGIVNNDIKRVVAYSTLSQLGYMTVALGVSAYSAGFSI
jgi:NADH-quinone oxidoreductase subunit K